MSHQHKTDRVERWIDLPAPAEKVWALISDFAGFDAWYPDLISSEKVVLEGQVHRHVRASEELIFLERLEEQGDDFYRYALVEGPFPVENYLATLTCFPEGEGCRVFWSCSFDAKGPDLDRVFASIFETGLEALGKRFGA